MFSVQFKKCSTLIKVAIFSLALVGGLFFTHKVFSASVSYTVCDSGCDFTTLAAALLDPGLDGDGLIDAVTLTADYVFDNTAETIGGTSLSVPNGVTIACEAGAETFGDAAEAAITIYTGSDFTLQDCAIENVNFDSSGATNVNFLDNTFSSAADSWLTLTAADGYEISGNTGIQRLQLQGADNGLIEGNAIECRWNNNCVNVVTAGAPDYSDPPSDPLDDHICNNVLINNNTITNYIATGNTGDWILANGGEDIRFTNNTVSSAVTLTDDPYLLMSSVQNAQVEFTGNYFITPFRALGATNTTWPFNVRVDQYHIDVLYEHNTLYGQSNNDICIGLWDGSNNPSLNINITANYNLCFNVDPTASGSAINLSYDAAPGNANVTLSDSFNGFYGFASPYIYDDSGVITSLNSNTVTSNPLFRTENISTADDYYPSPISRYLDVNGTLDIGAFSGARINNYLIDDDCVVDYTACFSNTSTVLTDAVSTGDTVNVAAGTYNPVELNFAANSVTFSGAGASTIFDAGGSGSAFSLRDISNSDFSDFKTEGSAAVTTTTYTITRAQYTDGTNIYDQAALLGLPADTVMIMTSAPIPATCVVTFYDTDGFDITSIVGLATSNWNLGLVNYGGIRFTVLMPDEFVPSSAVLATALGDCAPGVFTIEYFVDDIFTVSGGVFSYNSAAAAGAGVSVKAGETNPPSITRLVVAQENGGVLLDNASGNIFTNITSTGNDYALVIAGSSASNILKDSTLENSGSGDLLVAGTGDNTFEDVSFDRTSSVITGSGDTTVKYSVRAFVTNIASNPLSGAQANFSSANSLQAASFVTAANGFTPFSLPLTAYILTSSGILETSGGYNPYGLSGSLSGYQNNFKNENINTPYQTISLILSLLGGGGSGFLYTPPLIYGHSLEEELAERAIRVAALPVPVHYLVKLPDDHNPKTMQDTTVYYIGADGYRHLFVNERSFFTWNCDFSQVHILSASLLGAIPLGGNVTYRPGLKMIKFLNIPTVYAVQKGGILRAIPDENMAELLYGADWNRHIDDVGDIFYGNYTFGQPIVSALDFYPPAESDSVTYPSDNFGLAGYIQETTGTVFACAKPPSSSVVSTVWPFIFPTSWRFTSDLSAQSTEALSVKYLQDFLKAQGQEIYPEGIVNGNYGPLTTAAVKRFQVAHNIPQTGIVGSSTRGQINSLLESMIP